MTKPQHNLNKQSRYKVKSTTNNLVKSFRAKRVFIPVIITVFVLTGVIGATILRTTTQNSAQPETKKTTAHSEAKPLPEPPADTPAESTKSPDQTAMSPEAVATAPAPRQPEKPSQKAPAATPAPNPFTITRIYGDARAFCVGPGNAAMEMGPLSIISYSPPQQPTPVNWQIEFAYEGGAQIVDSGSYIAQPGERNRDFPDISNRFANPRDSQSAMRFRITSPNDIATKWVPAGGISCN